MSLQHIQKNSPRLLPKPAKFEKNPPNGYRVIRKTKCGAAGAGGAGGAGSSPIHKQASLTGRLIQRIPWFGQGLFLYLRHSESYKTITIVYTQFLTDHAASVPSLTKGLSLRLGGQLDSYL